MTPATPFEAACSAVERLRKAGFDAWIVGGAVRDRLLGVPVAEIGEFDVATDAAPPEIESLFARSFASGRSFGVVRVRALGHWVEVATFRSDGVYSDGRHPDAVTFTDAASDVRRRDFTVNGILWNPLDGEYRDEVGGIADAKDGLIRAIGDPAERFREDGLRILRAIRFASMRHFRLEPATEAALVRERGRLAAVSKERIRDELLKIFTRPESRRGDAWRLLVRTGLAPAVLPALDGIEHPETDADVLDRLAARSLPLALAAVLRRAHPLKTAPPRWTELAAAVARDLRLSQRERSLLSELLGCRPRYRGIHALRPSRVLLLATRPDREFHEDLLAAEGDAAAVLQVLQDRRRSRDSRPAPLLDGRALMAAGLPPGPLLGLRLRRIRVWQLEGSVATAAEAIERLRRHP